MEKRTWGRAFVYSTLLSLYYLVHLVKSRGKRTWLGAKNFFYDYIVTPQATFHSKSEIERWASDKGLELLDYDPNVGNVHVFIFQNKSGIGKTGSEG
jgi:hypothetical protein